MEANVCRILVHKRLGKRPVLRPVRKMENDSNSGHVKIGYVFEELIELAHDITMSGFGIRGVKDLDCAMVLINVQLSQCSFKI
jgi:hypothetical protein